MSQYSSKNTELPATKQAVPVKELTKELVKLDKLDKQLINLLQHGLPVCENPFAEVAKQLNSNEQQVLTRLNSLLDNKTLSRFGPMFDAACLGGAFTLAALSVPEERFEEVTIIVNEFEQIAHNYQRNNKYNMWFVIGTESLEEIAWVIKQIELKTHLSVLNTPKLEEFYVGLYLPV
jgi:DNA-binding Lrp family transcriptional regulator